MAQDQFQVKITFQDEAPQEVRSALEAVGAADVEERQQRAILGAEWILLGVLAASALAGLVARIARLWKCGAVVDARGPKVLVEKNCELPRGTVLVITPDGTESKLHQPSNQELNELIKTFAAGGA